MRHGAAIAVLSALAIAGCGSHAARRPSGAEPARAPAQRTAAAGRIVPAGAAAEAIAVAPGLGLVAVATRDPDAVTVLDASDGHVRWRVPLPGEARHLAVAGPEGPLLVPVESADVLLEVDLRTRRVLAIPAGHHPHDAAVAGGRVFAGDEFGNAATVIRARRPVARISGFLQPGGLVAVGGRTAVIDVAANTITLIDARTLRRLGRTAAGQGPTHGVADPRGDLYVVDTRGSAIERFATRPGLRRLLRVALPGTPYGIAIDSARHRLWVTLTACNQLAELAVPSLRVLHRLPTVRQPNTVAVDPGTGRVYVAGAASGVVQIVTPTLTTP